MPLTTDQTRDTGRSSRSPRVPASPRRLIASALVVGVLVAVLVAVTWPQAFGLHRTFGFAQLIAFRPALFIGFAIVALLAAGIALATRRRARRVVLVIAGVLLITALAQAAVLGARGWVLAFAPSDEGVSFAQGDLVALSWNTQGGATSPQAIAQLALDVHADVIALPETDSRAAGEVRAILTDHGVSMSSSTVDAEIPTSVLISTELGSYRLDASRGSTPGLPSGIWIPDEDASPAVVVAHPLPPLPAHMGDWRDGLDWVAEQCASLGNDVIVAGDLNATVDHLGGLSGCRDAAMEASAAASGTWPSTVPQALAAPIDHVLIGADWKALEVRVFDPAGQGSDHRPIVAVLRG